VENGGEVSHCSSTELMFFNVPAANLPTWHNLQEVTVEALPNHLPLGNPTNWIALNNDWKLNDDTADGGPARSREPL
jgi:hypothetical protein